MTPPNSAALRQRVEYTYKYNHKAGRQGWLRLTPAYSVKIVDELLARRPDAAHVLDPFCGTGTTALCTTNLGGDATTVEINPFLVWLAHVKTARYGMDVISAAHDAGAQVLRIIHTPDCPHIAEPPIHNIERWWNPAARDFLCRLRAAIEYVTSDNRPERDLLLLAFCRTLIELSNAAFNHQSMSFRDDAPATLSFPQDLGGMFQANLTHILAGAADAPTGSARIIHGDARNLQDLPGRYDLVISSPPYANRMSYIRELRPYMYWLGYLQNGRDAGELDWLAIGGTWGIATSRLADWRPESPAWAPDWLPPIIRQIAEANNTGSKLLARYVAKYADDMWRHFTGLPAILTSGARVHYIVGNSTFYGILTPTEQLYADMLAELGFTDVAVTPIRKRNSKKELVEFDVSARWR